MQLRAVRAVLGLWGAGLAVAAGESPAVLVLVNDHSPLSRSIAEYYCRKRGIPAAQVVRLKTSGEEEIGRESFNQTIRKPLLEALRGRRAALPVYLVTTQGMPLKIRGEGSRLQTDAASVDSELAALKIELLTGAAPPLPGPLNSPYFGAKPRQPPGIFLTARLAAFSFADVKAMIDRAAAARPEIARGGEVVLDQHDSDIEQEGNFWLMRAASRLPGMKVHHEETKTVAVDRKNVIAYAGWGSNDRTRRVAMRGERDLGLTFLPGAMVTEYVSTNGRTFLEPPPQWRFGEWRDPIAYFEGSPQSLAADWIRLGATAVSGHVYEPFIVYTPRPDMLFPAYLIEGRTMGEAFWSSIPAVSWMNVVVGDPLCRVK